MAVSACFKTVSGLEWFTGYTEMPILGVMWCWWPFKSKGEFKRECIFSATVSACLRASSAESLLPGNSNVNSSPSSLDAVSSSRSDFWSNLATWTRSSSPISCPRASLSNLKRSRSRNNIAPNCLFRCATTISWPMRSSKRRRLGRPVSGS